MSYNELVENCFFYPRHVGEVEVKTSCFTALSNIDDKSGKGHFCLSMSMNDSGKILQTRFKARGSPYLIAGLEWLCRQSEGLCLQEQMPLDYRMLIKQLDIPAKYYAEALLIEKAWREIMIALTVQYEERKNE